jgi:prepilin-type N-terminal cleavage/methylation domain-containing protein
MKKSFGFNLIEMAMVLLIVALLMSSILIPLPKQIDHKKIAATQQHLEEIKEALLGFVVLHERLPFPELAGQSLLFEEMIEVVEGYLPWINLGVGRYDAWGNPFRYRSGFPLGFPDGTDAVVIDAHSKEAPSGAILFSLRLGAEPKDILSAIIYSTGKNAVGDDIDLVDGKTCHIRLLKSKSTFPDITYCQGDYVENYFDDILIWLPKNIIVNRLVTVGKWPP